MKELIIPGVIILLLAGYALGLWMAYGRDNKKK